MFHHGARSSGGNLDGDISNKVFTLLTEFTSACERIVTDRNFRRGMVRCLLPASLLIVVDRDHVWVAAQKVLGMPSTISIDEQAKIFSQQEIYDSARWEFGFDDPYVIRLPAQLLEKESSERSASVEAIAIQHVSSELLRVQMQMNIVQINPLFGTPSFSVDQNLAFVLMPFKDDLTKIYQTLVKPTVEDSDFGLVCRRADDIKSNRAIMQDIWKSICEARLILADLTGLNANVMYELGIAHTVGKETILINQRGADIKFPFDLAHIRRIEYDDSATGGEDLKRELRSTLIEVLQPAKLAS